MKKLIELFRLLQYIQVLYYILVLFIFIIRILNNIIHIKKGYDNNNTYDSMDSDEYDVNSKFNESRVRDYDELSVKFKTNHNNNNPNNISNSNPNNLNAHN